MIRSALRHGKRALKQLLQARGLGAPPRRILRRVIHTLRTASPFSWDLQFDRTRISVAVQAEMTRAAIAHEADLIQALVRMQAASMAAALAEQSEQTRSLLFDMIQGYQSENGFATGSTDYEADDSARDASGFLDAVRQRLQEPLTSAEIIGACKVICAQLPRPEKVRELLEAHRRDLLEPSAVLLKIFELMPEGSDCLNSGVQRKLESQFRRGCCDNGTERLTA